MIFLELQKGAAGGYFTFAAISVGLSTLPSFAVKEGVGPGCFALPGQLYPLLVLAEGAFWRFFVNRIKYFLLITT